LARADSHVARLGASIRFDARSSAARERREQMTVSGIHDLALFIAAGLLLNLTPGPDMAYIAARSVAGGFRDGAAATLGITAGCVVHTIAAAAGLSALLATSATAFEIVKWCGAAYLLFAGVKLIVNSLRAAPSGDGTAPPLLP